LLLKLAASIALPWEIRQEIHFFLLQYEAPNTFSLIILDTLKTLIIELQDEMY